MQSKTGMPLTEVDSARWAEHVRHLTRNASGLAIARASGIAQSTISRWFDEERPVRPSAVAVIALARAYHGSIVEALVEAGYLTPAEARVERRGRRLIDVPLDELAAELARRTQVAS